MNPTAEETGHLDAVGIFLTVLQGVNDEGFTIPKHPFNETRRLTSGKLKTRYDVKFIMELKFSISPTELINVGKVIKGDAFHAMIVSSAYALEHNDRLPKTLKDKFPDAYQYCKDEFYPTLIGLPKQSEILSDNELEILKNAINSSDEFIPQERKVLLDMLSEWLGRGRYSRTELIYTKPMCVKRTGVDENVFISLRDFLFKNGCLTWENKPNINGNTTSFFRFNERALYNLVTSSKEDDSLPF